jgi:hypothetical protein
MVRIIYILGIMHAYKCPDGSASVRTSDRHPRPDARTALHFPYAPALYACLAFRTLTRAHAAQTLPSPPDCMRGLLVPSPASHAHHMCNTRSTFKTCRCNTCNICVKHMQHPDKHTCNICLKKIDETLETNVSNITVQPLQHMQHTDLLLQHLYETLATYL